MNRHTIPILFLGVLASLVALNPFGKLYPDSLAYLAYINGDYIPPFCYRPMLPTLASLFLDHVFGFVVVNSIFLIALTLVLYFICVQVGVSPSIAVISTTIATISSPVLFYSTAVLVDVSYIFWVALMILSMLHPMTKDKPWISLLFVCVGVCFKESAMIGSLIYLLYTKRKEYIPAFLLSPIVTYVLCRLNVGFLFMDNAQDFWFPRLDFLFMLDKIFYTIFLHLMGFIYVLFWIGLIYLVNSVQLPKIDWFLPIFVSTVGLMVYAITSASFDGRFVWPVYLALTPLVAVLYENLRTRRTEQE